MLFDVDNRFPSQAGITSVTDAHPLQKKKNFFETQVSFIAEKL